MTTFEDAGSLTEMEKSVLRCLGEGMHSKEIATRINRCKPTVEGYIRILYLKLHARSRAHLVLQAVRAGVISGT
jgi:LuxR family transcriptional regulator, transcriptional regulator of spore coat protein